MASSYDEWRTTDPELAEEYDRVADMLPEDVPVKTCPSCDGEGVERNRGPDNCRQCGGCGMVPDLTAMDLAIDDAITDVLTGEAESRYQQAGQSRRVRGVDR